MKFDFQKYFRDYGAAFDQPETLASFYGDCALASTPGFVGCLKGKAEVLEAMKSTATYQKKTRLQSMEPISVKVSELDSIHRLAKVQWKMKFENVAEISFSSSYLLREEPHKVSILLYLAHEDEEKMRKELGLT